MSVPILNNRNYNPSIPYPLYILRRHLYSVLVRHASSLTGRIMDFGCGTKPYKPLFIHATEYIGVDYRGEGHCHGHEAIDVYYDGKTIPFEDNCFDGILTSEVLEHVFNLDVVLDELCRVLKPGGKILITVPFVWNEHEMPNDFGRYTSVGLRHLLEERQLTILELHKGPPFFETLVQLHGLYWHSHVIPKLKPFDRVLSPMFALINNVLGLALAKVLPKRDDFFLNLVILAQKPG